MRKISLIFLNLLFYASSAYAIDMEYYTYGGFGPVSQAFNRLALIFSDSGFLGLFSVVMVLGIVAGAIGWAFQAGTGRMSVLGWTVPIILGAAIYLGMFVPKGNITVYDPVLNRFETIGGVPDAIVFTAGALNKLERGVVDIIDTSAAPGSAYKQAAGGIGFKTLESIRGSYMKNNHLRISTLKYLNDCVSFELSRPNTTLSLDVLRNETTNFLPELAKAGNAALYTTYYDDTTPEGVVKTCRAAWQEIGTEYQSSSNYDDAIRKVCSKASFNVDQANELNRCKALISDTMLFLTGTSVTPSVLIQQRSISEMLYNFYYQDDVESAVLMESNRKITSQGMGTGIAMNEWVPVIKAIMTAIAIGMIPFLALFLPTPIMGKALSAMFGFFCFLTIWGITDAVIHNAAMDYALYMFEDMKQSSLGVYAMASFPDLSVRMLSMFGVVRSSGIMLASLFTMMLVKFGGHALAMMAGQITGMVGSAGSQAGALMTPEGKASAMKQQIDAAGTLEALPQHGFNNMAAASGFNSLHSPVGGYNAAMNAKKVLEKGGAIPQGTSDKSFAQMKHSFNQQVGTAQGTSSMSLGLDGQATMMNEKSVMASGSTAMEGTGAGGTGVLNIDGAWGKGSFTVDAFGGKTLTNANVNGMAPMALARQNAHILTEKASHALGTNQGWDKFRSQVQSDGFTSNEARGYADKLSNSEAAGWDRAINDKSGFARNLNKDQQEILSASAGVPNISPVSGGYRIQTMGKDGKTLSFAVDESTGKSIKEAETNIHEKAFTETFGSGRGLQYATSVANKVGATEAASYMKDASNMSRTTETTGGDAMTAFVRWYSNDRYGSDSPENIDKAGASLNHMATSGDAGMAQLQAHQQRFLRTGNYTWGDGKAQVEAGISATRGEVGGGMANVQGQVRPGVSAASGRTADIAPGDFSGHPGDRHEPLTSPKVEGQKILDEAEGMRDAHINRTHIHEDGTKEIVEPFVGNQAVRAVTGEVDKEKEKFTNNQR